MTVTHADPGLREFDRTVLVVGATGAFGERLAEGLIRSGYCRDRRRPQHRAP